MREAFRQRGISALLWSKSHPWLVARALAAVPRVSIPPEPYEDLLCVGLVQLQVEMATNAGAYARQMARLAADAVRQGAQLVIFPEYTGLGTLGLLPGMVNLSRQLSLSQALEELGGEGKISLGDILRFVAPAARRTYHRTFSLLAQRLRVYLMAGTIILPAEDGRLYNCAHLYGPTGQLIGVQRKLHLYPMEEGWLSAGDELPVFELPFTRLAIPVCMDHSFWETARSAYLRGAEILIDPAADGQGDQEYHAARGVRMRVQESPCFGLHVYAITDVFGLHWRGRSCVAAPSALLPPGQHLLAQAATDDAEEVLIADLDLAALRAYRREHPLELQPALYQRYLLQLYSEITG
ncbi:MAG TPA: nitrilase-related carbon-nitrogen hydrolase [Armatimonadota bacterium]|jgi:predicted amidohydrolase